MKRSKCFFSVLALLATLTCRGNIVGYVNLTFQTGANWIANPLLDNTPDDSLATLFAPAAVPNGTTVSLWDPGTRQFATTSTYNNGSWSDNFILDPGMGALLSARPDSPTHLSGTS